jgi:hypothetical protein
MSEGWKGILSEVEGVLLRHGLDSFVVVASGEGGAMSGAAVVEGGEEGLAFALARMFLNSPELGAFLITAMVTADKMRAEGSGVG